MLWNRARVSRQSMGECCGRYSFSHNGLWQGNHYAIKQVAPVIKEESEEIVVITVYTFFF